MKFYAIALFIFILNISIGVMNYADLLHSDKQMLTEWNDDVESIKDDKYSDSGVAAQEAQASFGFGDFLKAVWFFIKALWYATIGVGFMYTSFGIPAYLAALLSLPVYLIYGVAIAQFIGNRGMKSMS